MIKNELALYALAAILLLANGKIKAEEQTFYPSNPIHSNPKDKTLPSSEKDLFKDKATGDWGGLRKEMQERGIEAELVLMPEGFDNFRGGLRRGCAGALTTDLKVLLDTEKAFCWEGGKVFLDLKNRTGSNPTTALVGDLQIFDQYNSPPYFQIFELWYQQTFCCDTLRFKIGKIDANTEFSVIENSYYFFNDAKLSSPSILGFPDDPHSQLGGNIFYSPCDCWKIGFGMYASNENDRFGIFSGDLSLFILTKWGAFMVGETDFFWKQDPLFLRDGNLKVGVWNHTGTFDKLAGGTQKGVSGYYIILNQTFWQPCEEVETARGIRGFLTFGQTDQKVGIMDWSLSSGISWTGLLKCRENDVFGFGPSYAHISSYAGLPYSYELAYEGFYCWQFSKWGSLTADLQYIVHPGGRYSNALVGTLNLEVHL